tara:strand:+ start:1173 stop:1340 length:168 start_codon:yes stop_codon:yes gene_type:complete
MKYRALRNARFRAGNPKKIFDVKKDEEFEVNTEITVTGLAEKVEGETKKKIKGGK